MWIVLKEERKLEPQESEPQESEPLRTAQNVWLSGEMNHTTTLFPSVGLNRRADSEISLQEMKVGKQLQ